MRGRRRDKAAPAAKAQAKANAKPSAHSKPTAKRRARATTLLMPPLAAPAPPAATRVAAAKSESEDFTIALGSAAHELKNGLGPLSMTLQTVERKLLAGEAVPPSDLAFARAQVRRLAHLVNDLLDVTHLDTDQFPLRARTADLVATVADAVDIFGRGNVRHVARALPSSPVLATFDPERVVQVVLNLLENAAKYAPLPAPITVTVARAPGGARVEIRDGGAGLSGDDQRRLFARFVRARGPGDGTHGLGLGLYLCRSIVERHGGRIGVESTPGAGATFWFSLPVV
jgi:signal transduction histidine kinase